ncbi:MAG TPA: ABC transporter substrate-binding protein [Acidimicrobiia bacterium]|nr:ABC transporter substrate-binding protein [Acidimicrobiia bacterium]
MKGKKLASPQLGNTQDVVLRTWLKRQGLSTTTTGGRDVSVVPQDNATTLQAFQAGAVDVAWGRPEPWATRLVKDGGGHVLVDEASLWPGGRYVTTLHEVADRAALLTGGTTCCTARSSTRRPSRCDAASSTSSSCPA